MARHVSLELQLSDVEAKAAKWSVAMNEHKTPKETKTLKKAAQDAMVEYNNALAIATYKDWHSQGDAIKTVVRTLKLPHAKKLVFKTDDSTGVSYFKVDGADVNMSLIDVEKAIGSENFGDEKWFWKIQKLALIIAGTLNSKLAGSKEFKYIIDDAAKSFDFPDGVDPNTSDGVVIALQQIFDSILIIPDENGDNIISAKYKGTEKCPSPAWQFIREAMTREGKEAGSINICNTAKMTELVLKAMHVILTNGDFVLSCE